MSLLQARHVHGVTPKAAAVACWQKRHAPQPPHPSAPSHEGGPCHPPPRPPTCSPASSTARCSSPSAAASSSGSKKHSPGCPASPAPDPAPGPCPLPEPSLWVHLPAPAGAPPGPAPCGPPAPAQPPCRGPTARSTPSTRLADPPCAGPSAAGGRRYSWPAAAAACTRAPLRELAPLPLPLTVSSSPPLCTIGKMGRACRPLSTLARAAAPRPAGRGAGGSADGGAAGCTPASEKMQKSRRASQRSPRACSWLRAHRACAQGRAVACLLLARTSIAQLLAPLLLSSRQCPCIAVWALHHRQC